MSMSQLGLLLLLMCLTFQSCYGRPFQKKRHEQSYGISLGNTKNKNIMGSDQRRLLVASNAKAVFSSDKDITSTNKTRLEDSRTEVDVRRPRDARNKVEIARKMSKDDHVDEGGGIDRAVATVCRSPRSVPKPSRVPQRKRQRHEEQPSFNLDYMQPITHPPHHN